MVQALCKRQESEVLRGGARSEIKSKAERIQIVRACAPAARQALARFDSMSLGPVGDGALGFWSALEEIYPKTRHQRCWMHKTGNVLNALPKTVQPKAKRALHAIWQAATREEAELAFDQFIETYEA